MTSGDIYIVIGVMLWPLNAAIVYHDLQGSFPMLAAKNRRADLGASVALGAMGGAVWPVALPLIYCFTGFAQHGIWKTKP